MEAVFTGQIRAERQRGRTVLLSSHLLSEVEQLCDRISIIRAGVRVEMATVPCDLASVPGQTPAGRLIAHEYFLDA